MCVCVCVCVSLQFKEKKTEAFIFVFGRILETVFINPKLFMPNTCGSYSQGQMVFAKWCCVTTEGSTIRYTLRSKSDSVTFVTTNCICRGPSNPHRRDKQRRPL